MKRTIAKRLPEKEFIAIFKKVPRLTVDVIIKGRAGIVFTKRTISPWKGKWHIPGGTIRFGERLKSAALRIIHHETGLTVSIKKVLGAIEYIHREGNKRTHSASVIFLASPVKGVLHGSPEGEEIRYFFRMPPKTIPEQKQFLKEHGLMVE